MEKAKAGTLLRTKSTDEIVEDYCNVELERAKLENTEEEKRAFKYLIDINSFKDIICDNRGIRTYNLDSEENTMTDFGKYIPYEVPLLLLKEININDQFYYKVLCSEQICYVWERDVVFE